MIKYLKVEYLFFYKHNVYKQIQAQICGNVKRITQPDLLLNRSFSVVIKEDIRKLCTEC